jgi:hypothetical protein
MSTVDGLPSTVSSFRFSVEVVRAIGDWRAVRRPWDRHREIIEQRRRAVGRQALPPRRMSMMLPGTEPKTENRKLKTENRNGRPSTVDS